jgi:ADP-heptose:LPS heptosyltransferase
MSKTPQQSYNSILITRIAHLGDTLLYTPALADLRTAFPEAHITVLANSLTRPALEGNSHLDEIITYEDSQFSGSSAGNLERKRFYDQIRRRDFDVSINFSAAVKDYVEAKRLGGKFRIAPVYRKMMLGMLAGSFLLDEKIICNDDPGEYERAPGTMKLSHEVEQNRKVTGFLGASPTETGLVLPRGKADGDFADEFIKNIMAQDQKKTILGVQLSDRLFWKEGRAGSIARFIIDLERKFVNNQVLCFSYSGLDGLTSQTASEILSILKSQGLPGESTKYVISNDFAGEPPVTLEKISGASISIISNLPLKRFGAILARCRMLVTAHSGATHISAAVGTPSVVIFNPEYYHYYSYRERPWNVKFEALPRLFTNREFSRLSADKKLEAEIDQASEIISTCARLDEKI